MMDALLQSENSGNSEAGYIDRYPIHSYFELLEGLFADGVIFPSVKIS